MIVNVLLYLISFSVFVILQSLAINGWHECFTGEKLIDGVTKTIDYQGMIGYMIAPKWIEKNKRKAWLKPVIGCIKCESSVMGGITFWGAVIPIFGFHPIEILVFIFDVFILVSLNWFIFKRL